MLRKAIPRTAAIHDLSGFGRSSLTTIIPILSTMGIQVCPLPTAVLSTHSKFPNYQFVDLTSSMRGFIDHWKDLKIDFDAIYSGFLGSPEQIDIVGNFIQDFSHADQLVIVDPVLGDDGALYPPLPPQMIQEMKRLIRQADIITPNITEAALLLDKPYNATIRQEEIKNWILELSANGPDTVIITSIPPEGSKQQKTAVIAHSKQDGRFWKVSCDYIPANYPGTGDAFTSVITGCLLQGDSLPTALDRAVQFISIAIRATFGHRDYHTNEGIMLERVLDNLKAPVVMSSYELV